MKSKHLLSVYDLTSDEIWEIFNLAKELKAKQKQGELYQPCTGKTLGMIFQKSSTRTRVSFEVGMYQLGGAALFLSANDIQIGRGETIEDTARVLSRYVDILMARTYAHADVVALAEHATIPVINGLSDHSHPCQGLTDLFTVGEKKGKLDNSLKLTYIGDSNNVAHSLLYACAKLGVNITISCPEGYDPDTTVVERSKKLAEIKKSFVLLERDPVKACENADVIYTDVWASMGQEAEHKKRLKDFASYTVNKNLVSHAKKDALFMHCLPAHRGEEVSAEVIDGPNSIIFDQAENRLHVQKAIMTLLLK